MLMVLPYKNGIQINIVISVVMMFRVILLITTTTTNHHCRSEICSKPMGILNLSRHVYSSLPQQVQWNQLTVKCILLHKIIPATCILLIEEILHQLIVSLSHYLVYRDILHSQVVVWKFFHQQYLCIPAICTNKNPTWIRLSLGSKFPQECRLCTGSCATCNLPRIFSGLNHPVKNPWLFGTYDWQVPQKVDAASTKGDQPRVQFEIFSSMHMVMTQSWTKKHWWFVAKIILLLLKSS